MTYVRPYDVPGPSFFTLTTFASRRRGMTLDGAVRAGELTRKVTMPAVSAALLPYSIGVVGSASLLTGPSLGVAGKCAIIRSYELYAAGKSWVVVLGFMFLLFDEGSTANAVVSPAKNPLTPEVSIVLAEFGLFNPLESGEQVFVPSLTVPHNENQRYGWIVLLDTKKPNIRWREEFTLPTAPAIWGSAETQGSQFISEDKRVSVMDKEVEPNQGLISHSWSVAPGDPKGRYIIRVIIENRLEEVFEFDVH